MFYSYFLIIFLPFQQILVGESNVVIAGGTESMSQAPFVVRNVRFGTALGGKYQVYLSLYFILFFFFFLFSLKTACGKD